MVAEFTQDVRDGLKVIGIRLPAVFLGAMRLYGELFCFLDQAHLASHCSALLFARAAGFSAGRRAPLRLLEFLYSRTSFRVRRHPTGTALLYPCQGDRYGKNIPSRDG